MGYEMLVGPEDAETEAHFLGTTSDVTYLMEWLESLPAEGFPRLKEFAEDFRTTDGTAMAEEIGAALADHPPTVRGVEKTATEIADTCDGLAVGELFRIDS